MYKRGRSECERNNFTSVQGWREQYQDRKIQGGKLLDINLQKRASESTVDE